MNQEQAASFEDISEKEILVFLSQLLLQKKQLKTINMFGGKGGFGLVLFVEEIQNPKLKYAVKAQSIINISTGQINENALMMCRNEADIMKNCKHKNIVEIHSDYEIGFYHFIQMNLCQCSLDDWIENNKQIKISDITFLNLTKQILDGLEYLHNMDYVLRDLSVKNILLTADGVIKLCDFGLAKKYDETFQSNILYTKFAKGVFFYYPPELYEDILNNKEQIKQNKKGDIWAFGICLSLIGGVQIKQYMNSWSSNFEIPYSPNISQNANLLIKYILNRNSLERPSSQLIREKINQLFEFDQSQIQTEKNLLNLTFYQDISQLNLNLISFNQQCQSQNKQQNLTQTVSSIHGLQHIYNGNHLISNQIQRIIDFQFKKAEELLKLYENLLQKNSDNNDILITLGFIEVQFNSNISKSKQYFTKALKNDPNDLDAYFGLYECVLIMREKQNYNYYIDQLNSQITLNSKSWRLYYYLAQFYFLNQQYNESEQYINKTLQLKQNSPLIISLQALIILKQNKGKTEEIKDLFKKCENLNQNNHPEIEFRRVIFEIKTTKDYNKAIQDLKQILDLGIKWLIVYTKLLSLYFKIQNQEQFNFYKNLLLENFSNCYIVYQYLGDFEKDQKQQIQYYSKSIQIYPQNYYCIERLEGLFELKDIKQIIFYYNKILEINPKDIQPYVKIGNLYKNIVKNDKKAIQYYKEAHQLDPRNKQILVEIAQLYYNQKEKCKSLEIYYNIIEIDSSSHQSYLQIGKLESELKCSKNSIQAYKQAISFDDKDYYNLKNMAYEYIEDDQLNIAIQLLNQLLKQTQQDGFDKYHSDCYLLIGKAEYKRKDYNNALYYLEQCLKYKNNDNYFQAQIYHLKCQVWVKKKGLLENLMLKKGFLENLKFQYLLGGFFSYLYELQNQYQQTKIEIEEKFYDNKQFINKKDVFIIAEALYEFNHYELSFMFFKKLIQIDPYDNKIYYYLGKMENLKEIQIIYFMKYISEYQRDVGAIRFLAENSLNITQRIKYYEQILRIDSNDIQSLEMLCELYRIENDQSKQLKNIESLLQIDGNNQQGLLQLIKNFVNNTDSKDSDDYFNKFVVVSKNSIQIIKEMSKNNKLSIEQKMNLYESKNSIQIIKEMSKNNKLSIEQKMNLYEQIFKIDPKNKIVMLELIQEYKILNQRDNYFKMLENLLQTYQNDIDGIQELIQAYIENDCNENQLQNYIQNYIQVSKYSISIIEILMLKKQFSAEQKIKCYQLIIKIKPKHFQSIENLAYLYKKLKLYGEYYKHLQLMEQIEPNNQSVLIELANLCYFHIQDYDKAIYYYNQYLQLDKTNIDIIKTLGQIYFDKKEFIKSKEMYEKCVQIEPKSSDALFKLGEIEQQFTKYCLSNENYKKADNIDPKNANISYNMGMNYYQMENYQESLKRLFKCISLDKNHARAYNLIGNIYLNKQNKKEESIAYFRKAIQCDIGLEDAYYNLGVSFIGINYIHEAVNCFNQLLQINSEYKESEYCKNYINENKQAEVKLYKKTSIDTTCNIF